MTDDTNSHADATDRSETEQTIMEAVYRVLCARGYSGVTTQRIADECGKSTATLHYYYGTKNDLMVAFLEFLLDRFLARVEIDEMADPDRRLTRLLDLLFPTTEEHHDLTVAMLEMRALASHDAAVRERFRANDEYVRSLLEAAISDGIDAGTFRDAEPARVSNTIMTLLDGARTRYVVLGDDEAFEAARAAADTYLSFVLSERAERPENRS